MKRKAEKLLLDWKLKSDRKPLLLKGVRQCGKTYILREFGEHNYDDVAYFNFEENETLSAAFNNDLDAKRILLELGIFRGKIIQPYKTLVIFDEIQSCGRAITALKYFAENAPDYHIVCAGSLLGVALAKPLSFPVGNVDFITLRPMDFQEFLDANGESILYEYLMNIKPEDTMPELINIKLSTLLKHYYVVGGMPESVLAWSQTHDIEIVEAVQRKILDSYELDFAKHAPTKDFPKLSAIWRSVPEQLAKENSKFIFGQVRKGWRAKDLEDALEWLIGAGLVYKVCRTEKPFMPMSAYSDPTFFKLYLCDAGLLRKLSKLPASVVYETNELYKEFKGAMTENYVLCELVNSVDETPYYWTSGNSAEVDFIVMCNADIVPIEVKSESNTKAKSLSEYKKKYNPGHTVITSMKLLSGETVNRSIPLYLISRMKDLL